MFVNLTCKKNAVQENREGKQQSLLARYRRKSGIHASKLQVGFVDGVVEYIQKCHSCPAFPHRESGMLKQLVETIIKGY